MSYVTAVQLVSGVGQITELSQLLDVDARLLAATVAGDPRDEWTPDECAAADVAMATINTAIAEADGECNARLAQRGYELPVDATRFPVLTSWARAIVRYWLNRDRDNTDDTRGRVERDYANAIRSLDLVAAGKLSLGAGDPSAAQSGGRVEMTSQPRTFTRDTLGRL